MKKQFLLCLLLVGSYLAAAQSVYESAVRYRTSSIPFSAAADSLIVHAGAPTSSGGENKASMLARWKEFVGSRISLDVAVGADMHAPMGEALASYSSYMSGACSSASNWTCLGPFNNYYGAVEERQGRVTAIWVDPYNTNYILAGSDGGGLWKTTNGGTSWHNITDAVGASGVLGMPGVYQIAVDPANHNIIYIALGADFQYAKSVGYQLGLAYSTDGGATWNTDAAFSTAVGDPAPYVVRVAYAPGTENLFAMTNYGGVFFKANPSDTWHDVTPNLLAGGGGADWTGLEFSIQTPGKIIVTSDAVNWAPSYSAFVSNLWVSDISGITPYSWTQIPLTPSGYATNYRQGAKKLSISGNDEAYIEFHTTTDRLLMKTPITTFSPTILNSNFPDNIQQIAVSPGNSSNIYVVNETWYGMGGIFGIIPNGNTASTAFVDMAGAGHADGRCIFIHSSGTNSLYDVVYYGSDGGICKKEYGHSSAESITGDGLAITQFYGFGNTEENENIMAAGAQDNGGLVYRKAASPEWSNPFGGDGYNSKFMPNSEIAIGEDNGTSTYGTFTNWGVNLTGGTFSSFPVPEVPDAPGVNTNRPIHYAPDSTAYLGYYHLWKLPYGASSWSLAFPQDPVGASLVATTTRMVDFRIDDNNNNNAYIAYGGQLFFSNAAMSAFPGWTDITPYICPAVNITSIEVDPNDINRIWVAFGNINAANVGTSPGSMTNRVWYSPDAGASWYDVSIGLSALPVNKLLYRRGSNDEIYAGTDVGVFKWNTATSSWDCFNNGLPVTIVMDLEFNYCSGKLRAATYGRGMWETSISNPPTVLINANATWNTDEFMTASYRVTAGHTLTITGCTKRMAKNASISAEPGAKIVVQNATLTNGCDNCMWKGLEARGQVSLAQTPTSNQGWIVLKNSIIEHAINGVSNSDKSVVWSTNGGIIQCVNTTFRDCQVAADFDTYDNFYPDGSLHPNVSYFDKCTFMIDDDYKGSSMGLPMQKMVNLRSVEGVSFRGCQFANWNTHAAQKGIGEGIRSFNSGFTMGAACPSGPTLCLTPSIRSRFAGFTNGIAILGTWQPPLIINIDKADFDSSSVGINISAFNNVGTTRCNFNVGNGNPIALIDPWTFGCRENIGIYIQNTQQFKIEENAFQGFPSSYSDWHNFGTVIANTGAVTNTVYRNSFDGLREGVCAIGINCTAIGSPYFDGLQVRCNAFSNNVNDVLVASDGSAYPSQGIGRRQFVTLPTTNLSQGNTFSGSTNNIKNNCMPIEYRYYPSSSGEHPFVNTLTTVMAAVGPNSCASTISDGGITTKTQLETHKTTFHLAQVTWHDGVTNYYSLLDGGNQTSLLSYIKTTQSASSLKSRLSSVTPWLSDIAIRSAVDRGLLHTGDLMDVLRNNASVFREADLLQYVTGAYSLTNTEVQELIDSSVIPTPRTDLEDSIHGAKMVMADEANLVMMALKSSMDTMDTVIYCDDSNSVFYGLDSNSYYYGLDSVNVWLQNIGELWTYYDRIGYYNFINDNQTAISVYSDIGDVLNSVTGTEIVAGSNIVSVFDQDYDDYALYGTIGGVILGAENDGRDAYRLTEGEIASLDIPTDPAFGYSKATKVLFNLGVGVTKWTILLSPCTYTLFAAGKPGVATTAGGSSQAGQGGPITGDITGKAGSVFKMYPNPASDVVTFECNAPNADDIVITVSNVLGEKVVQHNCNDGKWVWSTAFIPAGMYIYEARTTRGLVSKGKLVITK